MRISVEKSRNRWRKFWFRIKFKTQSWDCTILIKEAPTGQIILRLNYINLRTHQTFFKIIEFLPLITFCPMMISICNKLEFWNLCNLVVVINRLAWEPSAANVTKSYSRRLRVKTNFAIKVDPPNLESLNQVKNIPVGLLSSWGKSVKRLKNLLI